MNGKNLKIFKHSNTKTRLYALSLATIIGSVPLTSCSNNKTNINNNQYENTD